MRLPTTARALFARIETHLRGSRDAFALALLGIVVGVCAGVVSIAFRGTIQLVQLAAVPMGGGFADVPPALRPVLPLVGVLLAIVVLYAIARGPIATGVVHVLDRLAQGDARLPLTNAIVQFLAASLLLGCGMSMGREGPAIHLGAASGSLVGARFRMATSALRTLIGCGVAAATAAAFNTPLAGVILSIEVVLIEYTVGGFTPILLAAVAGATVGQLVYGSEPAFAVPNVVVGTLWELPWIAAMGLAIGAYAAAFVTLSAKILHATRRTRWWSAWIAAAVIVGTLGLAVPEIMGVGYDVIERTLKSEYSLATVAAIAALKLLATATGAGMRIPAGLIGPTFVMGAALGSVFGLIGTGLVPEGTSNVALYAMLGMAAMMAASLQAPLSALVATVELTGNPHLILPGILAIVTASLSAKHLFQSDSIFVTLRRLQPAQ